jgi:hypothetical protein
MLTIGTAYRMALEMQFRLEGEAVFVAAENAEACLTRGDENGCQDWRRICAILTHLEQTASKTVH